MHTRTNTYNTVTHPSFLVVPPYHQVDQMFVGKKMLRLCGGYGHMAVLTNGGDMIYSGNVELPEQQVG